MTDFGSDPIAWILGADDSSDFVESVWGNRWYRTDVGERARFADFLSLGQLDEVLGTYGVRHPDIKLVKHEDQIPRAEYLWRGDLVDPLQVGRLFADGATVIFGSLHDRHDGLRRLCAAISAQVTARAQTNIYLTPPASQGFKPHWDTHDVFVLQIEGSKSWRIYGGGPEQPLRDQKFDPNVHDPGDVEEEFTLEAGEALYVPRGVMHAATTTDEVSVHVTLGVIAYTWAELIADAVSEIAERDAEWRRHVPFGAASRPGAELADEVQRLLDSLGKEADLDAVLEARQTGFENVLRPRTDDTLRQAVAASTVSEEDAVQLRPGVRLRIDEANGRVALRATGREVDFPSAATPLLRALEPGDRLLAGSIDDGLDWASRRVVLGALIKEGLLMRSGAGEA